MTDRSSGSFPRSPGSGDPLDDLAASAAPGTPLHEALVEIHTRLAAAADGEVPSYIPALAGADPDGFGFSIVDRHGRAFDLGDHAHPFTIQSASKPFVFGLALETHGREAVLTKIGVEPTGEAFNAIELDEATNRPPNPMVNAGAIATADLIDGGDVADRAERMLATLARYAGRPLDVDVGVLTSERLTGHRNRAIAYLMLNVGMIRPRVEETLELYFRQCSVRVTAHDLAVMGATLANGGVNPVTGERAVDQRYVRDVLSVMYTCGMYDSAGEWAYRVGIPAKSGVGGGIVAVAPGRCGIGVYSPRLDAKGHSVRGMRACEELSRLLGLHVFECDWGGRAVRGRATF